VLGVDRVVLDGGVEPEAVALLAMVEGALERLAAAPSPGAAPPPSATTGAPPAGLAVVVLAVLLVAVVVLVGVVGRLRLGRLELGGDERVVLGAEVDLVVEIGTRGRPLALFVGARPCSRLKASICWTVTSSWCAIQASVRP